MTRTRRFAIALLMLLTSVPPALAETDTARFPRIRSTDRRLLALIDEGAQRSRTFRALVERIEHSDVVVYVMCDGDPRAGIAGRLTFVSAAGGNRYLVVRLAPLEPRSLLIAMLGHELQHAVEIAERPEIVDLDSLARAYARIGHINVASPALGIAYDSEAAVVAGRQVLGEVSALMGD